jgi:hypothetical protein
MVRHILFIILVSLVAACSTTKVSETLEESSAPEAPKNELLIVEITQGKMRKINGEYAIYEYTEDMLYEVNDRCVYNEEAIDCLRHGFKIIYDSYGKDLMLDCVARTNIAVNAGNVAHEKYIDTREDDFYMDLKASENEFVNVQYINGQPGLEDLQIETSCSYKGNEMFRFKQRIRFGQVPNNRNQPEIFSVPCFAVYATLPQNNPLQIFRCCGR